MKGPRPVTKLRKSGQLDEAFQLATTQAGAAGADEWDVRDLGWCLIDLVKRHAGDTDQATFRGYLRLLMDLEVPTGDTMLSEHKERTLSLADSDRRAVMEAKKLGKAEQHHSAVLAFAPLLANGSLTLEDKKSYGWELFWAIQEIFKASKGGDFAPDAIDTVKRHLNTYLKMGISEEGKLHSRMLQHAVRLSMADHLRLVAFAQLWNLDLFQPEDLRETRSTDSKVFPALAEITLQRASKEAANGGSPAEIRFIMPHLEAAVERFPKNIWLKLNTVKLLRNLGRLEEARERATDFARSKADEYWTWELVGDLETEPEMRTSCYAKALTCSDDDTFVTKVRLKFASLIAADFPGQARAEVERVIEHRRREGGRIPAEASQMADAEWFLGASVATSDRSFYNRFKMRAEELLFAHLPWNDASVGDEFVIKGQDGKKDRTRRRIYVAAKPVALEISVSASHPDIRRSRPGAPVSLQIETLPDERWKTTVHRIKPRPDGTDYDVVEEVCGVISGVNETQGLLYFIVAKDINGTIPVAQFPSSAVVGQVVALRLARYYDRKGARVRALSASPTSRSPDPAVLKPFSDEVEVSNGLGFSSGGIFIPANIITLAGILSGDRVHGTAVIDFNKKRGVWGWKAISAQSASDG